MLLDDWSSTEDSWLQRSRDRAREGSAKNQPLALGLGTGSRTDEEEGLHQKAIGGGGTRNVR